MRVWVLLLVECLAAVPQVCPPPMECRYGYSGEKCVIGTYAKRARPCLSTTVPQSCGLLLSPLPGFSLDPATGELTLGAAGTNTVQLYIYEQAVVSASGSGLPFAALGLANEVAFSVLISQFPSAATPSDNTLQLSCGQHYMKTFSLTPDTAFIRPIRYSDTGSKAASVEVVERTGTFVYSPLCDSTDTAITLIDLKVEDARNSALYLGVAFGPFYTNTPPKVTANRAVNRAYDDFPFSISFTVKDLHTHSPDFQVALGTAPFTASWSLDVLTLTYSGSGFASGSNSFAFTVSDSGNPNDPSPLKDSAQSSAVAFAVDYAGKFSTTSATWSLSLENGNFATTPATTDYSSYYRYAVSNCGPLKGEPTTGLLYVTEVDALTYYEGNCGTDPCSVPCDFEIKDPSQPAYSTTTALTYQIAEQPFVQPFSPPYGRPDCPLQFPFALSKPVAAASAVAASASITLTAASDLQRFTGEVTLPSASGTVDYEVSIGGGYRPDLYPFHVQVLSEADSPPLINLNPSMLVRQGVPFTWDVRAAIEDADQLPLSLSLSITIPPQPSTGFSSWFSESSGVVTWASPEPGGPFTFSITATDSCLHAVVSSVDLTVVGDPTLQVPAVLTLTLGETLTLDLFDALRINGSKDASAVIAMSGLKNSPQAVDSGPMAIDASSVVTWTPTSKVGSSGPVTAWVEVSGLQAAAVFTAVVNHPVHIKAVRYYEEYAVDGTTWSHTFQLHDLDYADAHSCILTPLATPPSYSGTLPTLAGLTVLWSVKASDGAVDLASVQLDLSCEESPSLPSPVPTLYSLVLTVTKQCTFDPLSPQTAIVGREWTAAVSVRPGASLSGLRVGWKSVHPITASAAITATSGTDATLSFAWTPAASDTGTTTFEVNCWDESSPTVSNTLSFSVKVKSHTPPIISVPSPLPILIGSTDWTTVVSISVDPLLQPVEVGLYVASLKLTGLSIEADTAVSRTLRWTVAGLSVWGAKHSGPVVITAIDAVGGQTQLELDLYPNDQCSIDPPSSLTVPYNAVAQSVTFTASESLAWHIDAGVTTFPAAVSISQSGVATFTPPLSGAFPVTYTIAVSATDNHPIVPSTCTQTLSVIVDRTNLPPVVNCPSSNADTRMTIASPWTFLIDPETSSTDVDDEDDESVRYSLSIEPVPSNVPVIQEVAGALRRVELQWTPSAEFPTYTLTITAVDKWGVQGSCTATLRPNSPTTCDTSAVSPAATEGAVWVWQLPLLDANNRLEDISVGLSGLPGASLSPTQEISWLPPDSGPSTAKVSYSLVVTFTDPGNGDVAGSCSFAVVVEGRNNPPRLVTSPSAEAREREQVVVSSGLKEGQAYSFPFDIEDIDDIAAVTAAVDSHSDPNFHIDSLTSVLSLPVTAHFTLTWTPQNLMISSGQVTLKVSDAANSVYFDVFFLNIQQIDDPPVLLPITPPAVTYLDSDYYYADIDWYDVDTPFQQVTVSLVFLDGTGVESAIDSQGLGVKLVGKTGLIRLSQYRTQVVSGMFRVKVCDQSLCSTPQTLTITLNHVNQLPQFSDSVKSVGVPVGATASLKLQATDWEGDSVTYCADKTAVDANNGDVVVAGDVLTWSDMAYSSYYSEVVTVKASDSTTLCTDSASLFTTKELIFCRDFACNQYPHVQSLSFDSANSKVVLGLYSYTTVTEVYLAGSLAACSQSGLTVECSVSGGFSKALPVVVKNASGYSVPVTAAASYPTPTISSVSPSVIYSQRHSELLLRGQDFLPTVRCFLSNAPSAPRELYTDFISPSTVKCISPLMSAGDRFTVQLRQGAAYHESTEVRVCDEPVFTTSTYAGHSLGGYWINLRVDLKCWDTNSVAVRFGGYLVIAVPASDVDQTNGVARLRVPARVDFSSADAQVAISTTPGLYQWSSDQATFTYTSTCLSPGNICASSPTVDQCPAGTYCDTGDSSLVAPVPCAAGTYQSQSGKSACTDCPVGSMCDEDGLTAPRQCSAGWICDRTKIDFPTIVCPVGYYCGVGTDSRYVAPGLTYEDTYPTITDAPSDHWLARGQGFSFSVSDFYGPGSSFDAQRFCPGYYDVPLGAPSTGASPPMHCPDGAFCARAVSSSTVDNSNQQAPQDCYRGYICQIGDGESFDTRRLCIAGYYCPGTSGLSNADCKLTNTSCRKCNCPPGNSCPFSGMNTPTLCSKGTYQPSCTTTNCKLCETGYYCDHEGIIDTTGMTLCPNGNDCPAGSVKPVPCGIGTFKPVSELSCKQCPVGFLCPEQGMTAAVLCPAGLMCLAAGLVQGVLCPAGKYCVAGTSINSSPCPSSSAGQPCFGCESINPSCHCPTCPVACPAGSMCPEGASSPIPCPPGSYQDQPGSATCKPCLAGYFCASSGLTSMTLCTAGYYCDQDSLIQPTALCPSGMICPAGTKYSAPQPLRRQLASGPIRDCATYNGSLKAGSPLYCPTGAYCSAGTYQTTRTTGGPVSCEAGTYNQVCGQGVCNSCPVGYSCAVDGTVDPSLCSLGTFSSGRSSTCDPCPIGTWGGTMLGKTKAAECPPCPAGMVCASEGISSTAEMRPCKPGFYCPEGSSLEVNLCPAGSYCPEGTKSLADAKQNACPEGRFCAEGTSATTADVASCSKQTDTCRIGKICPQNYFCPTGTDENFIACPLDTVSTSGASDITGCSINPKVPPKVYKSINALYIDPLASYEYTSDGITISPLSYYKFTFDRSKFPAATFLVDYLLILEFSDSKESVRMPLVNKYDYTPRDRVPLSLDWVDTAQTSMTIGVLAHTEGNLKFTVEVLSGFYSYESFQNIFKDSVAVKEVTKADRRPGYTFLAAVSRASKDTFFEPINTCIADTIGNDPAKYSDFVPQLVRHAAVNVLSGTLSSSDKTFSPQSQVSFWDQFPQSQNLYPMDYLPYISDCEGYGAFLPIYLLINSPLCKFVAEEDTIPVEILKVTTEPNGDSCDFTIKCRFSENFDGAKDSSKEFWVGAYELSSFSLMSFTRPQVTGTEYSDGLPTLNTAATGFDSRFYSSGNLIPLKASRGAQSYERGMMPRKVELELGYFQKTRVDKEVLQATMQFSDFDSDSSDSAYSFRFKLRALGWRECLDLFGFAEFLYYVFVFLLCLFIFGVVALFWFLNFSFSKILPRPKLKVSLYLRYSGRALLGIFLAILPVLVGIVVIWFPLSALTPLQQVTGDYTFTEPINPSSISDLDKV